MKTLSESNLIETYLRPLTRTGSYLKTRVNTFDLKDDAACIEVDRNKNLVITSDTLIEGVHFFSKTPYNLIAQKALRVNLSDLAAKGAEPLGYMLSVAWPSSVREEDIKAFCSGLRQDQDRYQISLIGGDTTRMKSELLCVTLTLVGTVKAYISRLNARKGDRLYLTGCLGEAKRGYDTLIEQRAKGMEEIKITPTTRRFLCPEPRLGLLQIEGDLSLLENEISAMDVSDGLFIDCKKMAKACGYLFKINIEDLPVSEPVRVKTQGNIKTLIDYVSFGDDYELLIATSHHAGDVLQERARKLAIPFRQIGSVDEGEGVRTTDSQGESIKIKKFGYDHFL